MRDRLRAVRGQQDVSAQIEQTGELVLSVDGFPRPGTRRGRQIAGDKTDGQKHEKCDPILRVGQIERPNRREKEEVERQHGEDRNRRGHPKPRGRRNQQHHEQKREANDHRVADVEPRDVRDDYSGKRDHRATQDSNVPSR